MTCETMLSKRATTLRQSMRQAVSRAAMPSAVRNAASLASGSAAHVRALMQA